MIKKSLEKMFVRFKTAYERIPFMSGFRKVYIPVKAEVEILENKAAYKVTPFGEEPFEVSAQEIACLRAKGIKV